MQRSTLIGVCLASSLLASSAWAAPLADRDPDVASAPRDITCSGPGFDDSDGLAFLSDPAATAAQRRSAIRLLFTAEHYRLRDGLTDYE
ncbi:hypothetical protein [Halomonas denitrificans]|uniref:hypothetical protein n=1 Tax=Halomonas denitrificans TaxID=370769 RepID=UPI001300ACAB|nr:hypothetical protein [Halomonas denitrificans]